MPPPNRYISLGQSSSEYMFALGFIAVVAIAGLTLLGNTLQDSFSGIIGPSNRTATAQSTPPGNNSVGNTPVYSSGALADLSLTMNDGSKVKLSGFPANLANLVETVGVDGATNGYAQSLLALADTLEKEGKATPDQAQSLRDFATVGYTLAQAQAKLREDYGKDSNAYSSSLVQYFQSLIDTRIHDSPGFQFQLYAANPGKATSPEAKRASAGVLKDLHNTYDKIKDSANFKEPAVQEIVNKAYTEIVYLNTILISESLKGLEGNRDNFEKVEGNIVATVQGTRDESTNVCHTGNGDGRSLIACVRK